MTTNRTRLYLVMASDADIEPNGLDAALAAGDVACLLIGKGSDGTIDAGRAGAMVRSAQTRGVAALIEDDGEMANRLDADGVHLSERSNPEDTVAALREARAAVGSQAIVGASAGSSRHGAMLLGEAGADYVAFATPQQMLACEPLIELVAWWAELFELPAVALGVASVDAATALAAAGADFIGIAAAATAGTPLSRQVAAYDCLLQSPPVTPP